LLKEDQKFTKRNLDETQIEIFMDKSSMYLFHISRYLYIRNFVFITARFVVWVVHTKRLFKSVYDPHKANTEYIHRKVRIKELKSFVPFALKSRSLLYGFAIAVIVRDFCLEGHDIYV